MVILFLFSIVVGWLRNFAGWGQDSVNRTASETERKTGYARYWYGQNEDNSAEMNNNANRLNEKAEEYRKMAAAERAKTRKWKAAGWTPPQFNTRLEPEAPFEFFRGYYNQASAKSLYRGLMKIYHPDGGDGNLEVAALINNQFDKLAK